MPQNAKLGCACGTSVPGLRKINFPDGDQVGLIGLDEMMHTFFREGKVPDDAAARELIDRLREKNYISSNPSVEAIYQQALLTEYRRYFESKKR
jgi:hypothetical protein